MVDSTAAPRTKRPVTGIVRQETYRVWLSILTRGVWVCAASKDLPNDRIPVKSYSAHHSSTLVGITYMDRLVLLTTTFNLKARNARRPPYGTRVDLDS